MKKKIRPITFEGKLYHWLVDESFWPKVFAKVWLGPEKNAPSIRVDFDQPIAVTPRIISIILKDALERPVEKGEHIYLWDHENMTLLTEQKTIRTSHSTQCR